MKRFTAKFVFLIISLLFTQSFQCEVDNIELKVYPNPAYGDYCTVELIDNRSNEEKIEESINYQILLSDINGKEIVKQQVESGAKNQIDISKLISGSYIVSANFYNQGVLVFKKSTILSVIK